MNFNQNSPSLREAERRARVGRPLPQGSFIFTLFLFLTACTVGPDYKRPTVSIPPHFKEAPKGWKVAQPKDDMGRGAWWTLYQNPELNSLEQQFNAHNQSVAEAEASYRQALALVDEARASYFPTLTGSVSLTRQKRSPGGSIFNSVSTSSNNATTTGAATAGGVGTAGGSPVSTFHSLLLSGSWEPDLWGAIHRSVEASVAGAQANAALLASTRLSAQASLAQYYFELRALDSDQQLLNDTVKNYQKTLQLVRNQYHSGVAARADLVQAQSQLEAAQAQAINNGVSRAQYEHAIAVLIGQPPETFSLPFKPLKAQPPAIPLQVPTRWLERRPDIAQAERLMAQGNAQIGVAISAFYPTFTLTGTTSYAHNNFNNWFSVPGAGWAIGPQLAQLILDGGLREATVTAARANFESLAAAYRQTVLAAFQDVEDNLAALRILGEQAVVEKQAVASARLALKLVINQYKAGTVAYASVITAQTAAFTAEKTAADIDGLRMTASVGLIKALGGGWNAAALN